MLIERTGVGLNRYFGVRVYAEVLVKQGLVFRDEEEQIAALEGRFAEDATSYFRGKKNRV